MTSSEASLGLGGVKGQDVGKSRVRDGALHRLQGRAPSASRVHDAASPSTSAARAHSGAPAEGTTRGARLPVEHGAAPARRRHASRPHSASAAAEAIGGRVREGASASGGPRGGRTPASSGHALAAAPAPVDTAAPRPDGAMAACQGRRAAAVRDAARLRDPRCVESFVSASTLSADDADNADNDDHDDYDDHDDEAPSSSASSEYISPNHGSVSASSDVDTTEDSYVIVARPMCSGARPGGSRTESDDDDSSSDDDDDDLHAARTKATARGPHHGTSPPTAAPARRAAAPSRARGPASATATATAGGGGGWTGRVVDDDTIIREAAALTAATAATADLMQRAQLTLSLGNDAATTRLQRSKDLLRELQSHPRDHQRARAHGASLRRPDDLPTSHTTHALAPTNSSPALGGSAGATHAAVASPTATAPRTPLRTPRAAAADLRAVGVGSPGTRASPLFATPATATTQRTRGSASPHTTFPKRTSASSVSMDADAAAEAERQRLIAVALALAPNPSAAPSSSNGRIGSASADPHPHPTSTTAHPVSPRAQYMAPTASSARRGRVAAAPGAIVMDRAMAHADARARGQLPAGVGGSPVSRGGTRARVATGAVAGADKAGGETGGTGLEQLRAQLIAMAEDVRRHKAAKVSLK